MTLLTRSRGRQRFFNQPFSPSQLFLGGIQGAWYDPSDNATMFQDAAGTTPVTAVEQPVGLVFDKRTAVVPRVNRFSYSEQFATSPWSLTATTATNNAGTDPLGGSTASRIQGAAGWVGVFQDVASFPIGTTTISVWVKSNTGANQQFRLVLDGGFLISADLTATTSWQRFSYTATTTYALQQAGIFRPSSGAAADLLVWGAQLEAASTASTYQKITSGIGGEWTPGNHAFQSTAASRPVLRARYNLLTYSEDFGNAAWLKTNCTIASNTSVAPDGTTTADTMQLGAGTAKKHVSQTANTTGSRIYSIYVKYSSHQYIQMMNNGALLAANFDIQNGVAGTTYNTTSSITSVGNGWYRCTMTHSDNLASDIRIYAVDALNAAFDASTSSTGAILLWGAQLLTAADAAATGNAYQRVGASTDYATGGVFRPYLAFDGVDDRLQTASVNIASNAVSLFAGHGIQTAGGWGSIVTSGAAGGGGSFLMISDTTGAAAYQNFRSEGTLPSLLTSSTFAYPYLDVWTMQAQISTDTLIARRNGAQTATSSSDQGSGSYASNIMYVGSYNGANWHYPGRIYGLIVRGAASSAVEVAQTESWLNAKTGAY